MEERNKEINKGLVKKIWPLVVGTSLLVGTWGYGFANYLKCEKLRKDYPIVVQSEKIKRTFDWGGDYKEIERLWTEYKNQFPDEIKEKIEFYDKYALNGYGSSIWLFLISSGLFLKGANDLGKRIKD